MAARLASRPPVDFVPAASRVLDRPCDRLRPAGAELSQLSGGPLVAVDQVVKVKCIDLTRLGHLSGTVPSTAVALPADVREPALMRVKQFCEQHVPQALREQLRLECSLTWRVGPDVRPTTV